MVDELHFVMDLSHIENTLVENEAVSLLYREPGTFVQEVLLCEDLDTLVRDLHRTIYDSRDYDMSMLLEQHLHDAIASVMLYRDSHYLRAMDMVTPIRPGLYRGVIYVDA